MEIILQLPSDIKWVGILNGAYELIQANDGKKNRHKQHVVISESENYIQFETVISKATWTFILLPDEIRVHFQGSPGAFAGGSSAAPTYFLVQHGARIIDVRAESGEELYVLWKGKKVYPEGDKFLSFALQSFAHACVKCKQVMLPFENENKVCTTCSLGRISRGTKILGPAFEIEEV